MLVGVLKRNYLISLIYNFLTVSIAHLFDNLESGQKKYTIVLEILNFVIQKFVQTLERRE